MHFRSFAGAAAGLTVMATVLAACVVVEDDGPGYRPPPPERPQYCTREYDPVCGERRGRYQTFGNACTARADGFRVAYGGECRSGGGGSRPPQACTQEYAPVCGERRGRTRTFGNDCMARADGYRVVHGGECRRDGRPDGRPPYERPGSSGPGGGYTNWMPPRR